MSIHLRRSLVVAIGAVLFAGGSIFLPNRPLSPVSALAQATATSTATVRATATGITTATPTAVTALTTATPTAAAAFLTPVAGDTTASSRTVTVSGTGSALATPDIAYVDLGVTTDAETAREALTQNNQQMQALMTALQAAGIANADIRTQTIQLYPRYDTTPPQPVTSGQAATPTNQLIGFTATNTVEITVRKLDSLGQVLDQAVTAGSNQVQGIRFDVTNPTLIMDQARETAMRDAIHKAQQLASLADARLGLVVTVNENSNRPVFYGAVGGPMTAQAQPVPVSPGSQTITVDVQVTWELR